MSWRLLDSTSFGALVATLALLAGVCLTPSLASAQTCDNGGAAACRVSSAGHLGFRSFSAGTGDVVTVGVRDNVGGVFSYPYYYPADPEIWIVEVGSLEQGRDIIAYDDDGNGGSGQFTSPEVSFTVASTNVFEVYITARSTLHRGSGTYYLEINGIPVAQNQVNYRSSSKPIEFRDGDSLLLTKDAIAPTDPNSPAYADTRLLVVDRNPTGPCVDPSGSSCGTLWYNDDDLGTLSRLDLNASSVNAGLAFVGTVSTTDTMHTRLYHLRRHTNDGGDWLHLGARDLDNDGLPAELEDALGTCDTKDSTGDLHVKAGLTSCLATRNWINQGQSCDIYDALTVNEDPTCWTPADSDHDGMTDFEELYGVRRCYSQLPDTGLGYVGACIDADNDLLCDNECTGTYERDLALSALDSPLDPDPIASWRPVDPRYFDLLVDEVYTESRVQGQPQSFNRQLSDAQIRQAYYSWEEEPTECMNCARPTCELCPSSQNNDFCRFDINGDGPAGCCDDPATDCPGDDRYEPRLHLFETPWTVHYDHGSPRNTTPSSFPKMGDFGGAGFASGRLVYTWDVDRRYTDAFRMGHVEGESGGQAYDRVFLSGGADSKPGATFLHELGHTLGVSHRGVKRPINWVTLMDCHHRTRNLKLRGLGTTLWDGRLDTCQTVSDCADSDFFRCVPPQESTLSVGYCLPLHEAPSADEIWPFRFSRGQNANTTYNENSDVNESGVPRDLYLAYMTPQGNCMDSVLNGNLALHRIRRFVDASGNSTGSCAAGGCVLDFDDDGNSGSTNVSPVDINDFQSEQDFVQTDFDDWAQMLRRSKGPLFTISAQTTMNNVVVWASAFNAPAHLHAADGSCTGTCATSADAENLMGWQSTVTLGSGTSFDLSPFSGNYGHWLRFLGEGTDSHAVIEGDDELEVLHDTESNPYNAFEISMWVRLDDNGQEWHALVETGMVRVLMAHDAGNDVASFLIDYNSANGWQQESFEGVDWLAHEQRRVHITFNNSQATLNVRVSEAVGNGSGPDSRRGAGVNFNADQWEAVTVTPLNEGAVVGDILLGFSEHYELILDGWLDDVSFRRF